MAERDKRDQDQASAAERAGNDERVTDVLDFWKPEDDAVLSDDEKAAGCHDVTNAIVRAYTAHAGGRRFLDIPGGRFVIDPAKLKPRRAPAKRSTRRK